MDDIVKVKIKELNYNKKLPLEYELTTKSGGREKNGFWGKISNILLFLFGIKILNYDWEKLEKSLRKEGYNTSKYGYIEVHKNKSGIWSAGPGKFSVLNGNHRVFLLQKLYGNEHEIEVRTNTNGISMIIKNVKESLDTKTPKPKTTKKEKIKKLLVWCKLLIPTVYMFGFHFVDTLLLFIALVLSQNVLKPAKDLKTFDTLNNKWLDVIWRNVYYNHKMIVTVLILLIYILHLIIGDFTGFMLMLILYFVVEKVREAYKKTNNI